MPQVTHKLLRLGIALPFVSVVLSALLINPFVVLVFSAAGLFIGVVDRKKDRRLARICMILNAVFIILFIFAYYSLKQAVIND